MNFQLVKKRAKGKWLKVLDNELKTKETELPGYRISPVFIVLFSKLE